LVQAIPPVGGKVVRPRWKPNRLYAGRAYDSHLHRVWLWLNGIEPVIARRGTPHGSGFGRVRWGVERSLSWLHQFRRLRVRYEPRADIHEALLTVGCVTVFWNNLQHRFRQRF
jgi:transposase